MGEEMENLKEIVRLRKMKKKKRSSYITKHEFKKFKREVITKKLIKDSLLAILVIGLCAWGGATWGISLEQISYSGYCNSGYCNFGILISWLNIVILIAIAVILSLVLGLTWVSEK